MTILILVTLWSGAFVTLTLPEPSLPPAWMIGGIDLLGGLVIAWAIRGHRPTVRAWLVSVALLGGYLAGVGSLGHLPIVRFRALYAAIGSSMNPSDLQTVIHRHFPGRQPSVSDWWRGGIYINLEPVEPNWGTEAIGLDMIEDRVVGKMYIPD